MLDKHHKNKKKILLIVNSTTFFLSHRLDIALEAKKNGYSVHIATLYGEDEQFIRSKGLKFHHIYHNSQQRNIFGEIKTLISLIKLFKKLEPNLVHLVTIRPVIFGSIAARFCNIKSVIVAISGLGSVFLPVSKKDKVRLFFVKLLYKIALSGNFISLIFQNNSDIDEFKTFTNIVDDRIYLIEGSGVNLSEFQYIQEQNKVCTILMASRFIRDKGIYEYISAARRIIRRIPNARFLLVGDIYPNNLSSISNEELIELKKSDFIDIKNFTKDIRKYLYEANIVCLPSYREGMPKFLIEAASCGRAVVTTDTPGCRDVVIHNETGLLVPVKDSESLANAIEFLILNPEIRKLMGKKGRMRAEKYFSIQRVVDKHIEIYKKLLN